MFRYSEFLYNQTRHLTISMNVKLIEFKIFVLHVPCSLDIDECSSGIDVCHLNANCINAVGSHNCTCKEGFTGDGHTCLGTASFSTVMNPKFRLKCFFFSLHVTCSTDIVECSSNGSHV